MVVGGRELIDTLWNVNAVTEAMPDISVIELIDTLWNVNLTSKQAEYLQGCELIDTLWNVNEPVYNFNQPYDDELIDTLWNVNKKNQAIRGVRHLGINRYIMECKCYQTFLTPFPAEN